MRQGQINKETAGEKKRKHRRQGHENIDDRDMKET